MADVVVVRLLLVQLLLLLRAPPLSSSSGKLPMVINTWPFLDANKGAVAELEGGGSYLDAIEKGCSTCEQEQCDGSVGYGGSPDELGHTTLDAMIMDGESHGVGAVGCLKDVRNAIGVARSVLQHTKETILVGEDASDFAVEMGFQRQSLSTNHSRALYTQWLAAKCQPNYWREGTVAPDPTTSCGPYKNAIPWSRLPRLQTETRPPIDRYNHDTIGMVVINEQGGIGCGTSTNGASHKIAGRVGDSPYVGAGCYVDKEVGGAAATGDGDVMMRFLPTYQVVESMRLGLSPTAAAEEALARISRYYPTFSGALIAVNISGDYGAANHGFSSFHYTVYNPTLGQSTVFVLP